MKQVKDILEKVDVHTVVGDSNVPVEAICFDSRLVKAGTLFVAQRGVAVDGHDFIAKAIASGARTVVCEQLPEEQVQGVTYVKVGNASRALAVIAANFYNHPSAELTLVGVTGTNGKTTVASLLYQLFVNAGYKVGLLSTVRVMVGTEEFPATHTTPDSVSINHYMRTMVDAGVTHCFMEVSSHGIHQCRTEALEFDGGVFTNLSHDHLDYHNTFAAYRDVKKAFFDGLSKKAFALVNSDDKNGNIMLQNTKAKKLSYALKSLADYKGKVLEKSFSGSLLTVNNVELWIKLIGSFNAYNVLAIYAVAVELGMDSFEVLRLLSELESVSGRFQYTVSPEGVTAIVDYAHTPDALKNVLQTINDIRTGKEQVMTVVGCGGDRDKTKRPKMAQIAAQLSSQAIFTADNPRTENPQTILDEMEAGVPEEHYAKTLTILDRRQAIKTACKLAKPGDIILIAGKGHETYQEIQGERQHFDDMEEVVMCFKQLKG